jgi:hypothetical protein
MGSAPGARRSHAPHRFGGLTKAQYSAVNLAIASIGSLEFNSSNADICAERVASGAETEGFDQNG